MRNVLMAGALATALTFGGCATTGDPSPGQQIDDFVAQVQSVTQAICRFIPTAATVAAIISAGNPLVDTAAGIATGICTAITAPRMAGARVTVPTYRGVPIQGRRV